MEPKYYIEGICDQDGELKDVKVRVLDYSSFGRGRRYYIDLSSEILFPEQLTNLKYHIDQIGYGNNFYSDPNGIFEARKVVSKAHECNSTLIDGDGNLLLKEHFNKINAFDGVDGERYYICSQKNYNDTLVNKRSVFKIYKIKK